MTSLFSYVADGTGVGTCVMPAEAEEKLDFFPFVCLFFEGGTAAQWSAPSPRSRFAGLIPARRSPRGV